MIVRCQSFVHDSLMSELIQAVRTQVSEVLRELFATAVRECELSNGLHRVLLATQGLLARIPMWSAKDVSTIYDKIKLDTDDLDTLIRACVDSRVAVFTHCYAISTNGVFKHPDTAALIHDIFVQAARLLYNRPFLIGRDSNPTIRGGQDRELRKLVGESIRRAIASIVPMRVLVRLLPVFPQPGSASNRIAKASGESEFTSSVVSSPSRSGDIGASTNDVPPVPIVSEIESNGSVADWPVLVPGGDPRSEAPLIGGRDPIGGPRGRGWGAEHYISATSGGPYTHIWRDGN